MIISLDFNCCKNQFPYNFQEHYFLNVTFSRVFYLQFSEYCEKYAKPEDIGAATEENSSDEELSEDEYDSSDEQVAGKADP